METPLAVAVRLQHRQIETMLERVQKPIPDALSQEENTKNRIKKK